MHEMSLCEGILQILEKEAKAQSFSNVKMVCLAIGELSSVEVEALGFCFDVVMANTIADGATLEIEKVAGKAWCMMCSQSVSISRRGNACPNCGSYQLQITEGEDMKIKELEVA